MRRALWYFLSAQKVRINKSTVLFATKLNGKIYSKYTYFLVFSFLFTLILLLLISWQTYLSLLFVAQKVAKRHSTDKISHFLLCSGILQSKISFVRRSFAGNFPLKDTGVSNLATLCVSENLPLFSVPFCSRCL